MEDEDGQLEGRRLSPVYERQAGTALREHDTRENQANQPAPQHRWLEQRAVGDALKQQRRVLGQQHGNGEHDRGGGQSCPMSDTTPLTSRTCRRAAIGADPVARIAPQVHRGHRIAKTAAHAESTPMCVSVGPS